MPGPVTQPSPTSSPTRTLSIDLARPALKPGDQIQQKVVTLSPGLSFEEALAPYKADGWYLISATENLLILEKNLGSKTLFG